MIDELRTLDAVKSLKLDILRKGPHALFEDQDGLLIHCPAGSKAEAATEAMPRFRLIGVYDKQMKIAAVLADIGA